MYVIRGHSSKYASKDQETRPPVRKEDDTFWESTWEAMQLQKKADIEVGLNSGKFIVR